MAWCEGKGVDYVFGLARNERLVGALADDLATAELQSLAQGRPARRFADFAWRTLDSWSRERRVPALRRDLAAGECDRPPRPLRERLLRPRRGREPDQGAATRPVRGSHVSGDHARQPVPAVVRLFCLRPARRAPPDRTPAHPVRGGDMRHHPAQALEDWRAGAQKRAPDQGRHACRSATTTKVVAGSQASRPAPIRPSTTSPMSTSSAPPPSDRPAIAETPPPAGTARPNPPQPAISSCPPCPHAPPAPRPTARLPPRQPAGGVRAAPPYAA